MSFAIGNAGSRPIFSASDFSHEDARALQALRQMPQVLSADVDEFSNTIRVWLAEGSDMTKQAVVEAVATAGSSLLVEFTSHPWDR